MKKIAVLLYPLMSVYEISVAMSVLAQGKKPMAFFSAEKKPVYSEEALPLMPEYTLEELDVSDFDALLLTGSMDPWKSYLQDARYQQFVQQFNRSDVIIGAISSGPALLAMSDMLIGKMFTCGVPEEIFSDFKLDATKFKKKETYVEDGNILTAPGWYYKEFGIRLGEMLQLEFEPAWY